MHSNMKYIAAACLLLLSLFSFSSIRAQDNGIYFESGLSWKNILAKARAENKYIFVDCYATWCGPCKYMTDSIFTQNAVGDFFNSHFLNVSVQLDRTANDLPSIKDWYTDAEFIKNKYTIDVLPTCLFFSPDGGLVHRVVGIPGDKGSDLIEKGVEAMDPRRQYETLIAAYKGHLHDSAFLRKALEMAIRQTDQVNMGTIGDAYFSQLKAPYQKEMIALMTSSIQSTRNIGFRLLLDNLSAVDSIMSQRYYANYILDMTITREWIDSIFQDTIAPINYHQFLAQVVAKYQILETAGQPRLSYIAGENFKGAVIHQIRSRIYDRDASPANWNEISIAARARYVDYDASQIILDQKWSYYVVKKDTANFEKAVFAFLEKYHRTLSAGAINKCCYYIYLFSDNPRLLHKAVKWTKAVANDPKPVAPAYLDTYASLLFKVGDKKNAILWEGKAVNTATIPAQKREFENTLKKWTSE